MAIPFPSFFPKFLCLLAVLIYFTPELSKDVRAIGVTGLWVGAMFLSFMLKPKGEPLDRLPRIIWDERDGGEKFSIIMFHLLIAVGGFFFAYQITLTANSNDGNGLLNIAAAALAASTVWLIWSNWKNRNAR